MDITSAGEVVVGEAEVTSPRVIEERSVVWFWRYWIIILVLNFILITEELRDIIVREINNKVWIVQGFEDSSN